jgi:hypothetical protein
MIDMIAANIGIQPITCKNYSKPYRADDFAEPPLFHMMKACGITYLVSKFDVICLNLLKNFTFKIGFQVTSLQDAWTQCCSMNMNPLQLETVAEFQCLQPAAAGECFFF